MNYVVTRKSNKVEHVLWITQHFNFSKRAATQLRNALTKSDPRFSGRAIMSKTAQKDGLI